MRGPNVEAKLGAVGQRQQHLAAIRPAREQEQRLKRLDERIHTVPVVHNVTAHDEVPCMPENCPRPPSPGKPAAPQVSLRGMAIHIGIRREIAAHEWELPREISHKHVACAHLVHGRANEAEAAAKLQDGSTDK